MGKLHTLRRQIERCPSEWWKLLSWVRHGDPLRVRGAHRYRDGRWAPDYNTSRDAPYRSFVRSVLYDIYLEKYVERVGSADNAPETLDGLIAFIEVGTKLG